MRRELAHQFIGFEAQEFRQIAHLSSRAVGTSLVIRYLIARNSNRNLKLRKQVEDGRRQFQVALFFVLNTKVYKHLRDIMPS